MATLSEIIYLFKDLPRQGNGNSRSNNYTDREIAFLINTYRAKLINQKIDRVRNNSYIQSLTKVEVEKVSKINCMDIDEDIRNCIFRTKLPIPNYLSHQDRALLSYVGVVDGLKSWQETSYNMVQFKKYAPYTSNSTQWYYKDDYIYIVNPPTQKLKYINITGIFEKPEEINELNRCAGVDCPEGYDFEYPMATADIDTIFKMIADAEYRVANMLPKDTLNNSSDAN